MDNCVSPPELDDRQLLLYLDGERSADIVAHLERCPYCRERSHQLARVQNYLTAQLYRITCPPSVELGDYVLGMLPANQSAMIADHLQNCPHCTQEVSQLTDYLGELGSIPKANPVEQVKVLIARMIDGIELGKLFGGMTLAPAYATLRGGTSGTITLQADGILIILEVQPATTGRKAILGQIASDEQDRWTGAKVELYRSDVLLASDSVNDFGAFHCDGILPGAVELKIIPLSGPIVLAKIEIIE